MFLVTLMIWLLFSPIFTLFSAKLDKDLHTIVFLDWDHVSIIMAYM